MSVPVNQRSHGKLEAYAKAYELATYTLKITKNKKIFTEEYQDCLTDYIISAALDIYMCTGTANGKQVRTEKDKQNYEERIAAQRKALDRCGDLLKLIMLAKPIFHLSSKRVKYWVGLTKLLQNQRTVVFHEIRWTNPMRHGVTMLARVTRLD